MPEISSSKEKINLYHKIKSIVFIIITFGIPEKTKLKTKPFYANTFEAKISNSFFFNSISIICHAKIHFIQSEQFNTSMNKQSWMTEASGNKESWEKPGNKPTALKLAMDIHSAMFYGNISDRGWWQGSRSLIDDYSLMSGTRTGKKYRVSKHFCRYIRSGPFGLKQQPSLPYKLMAMRDN